MRKWNSSEPKVLEHIDPSLLDQQSVLTLPQSGEYTKTLGVEWNPSLDHFRLAITSLSHQESVTKRAMSSDIARIFDVLGWMAPVIVKAKVILQRLWEEKLLWDDIVPEHLKEVWLQYQSSWRNSFHAVTSQSMSTLNSSNFMVSVMLLNKHTLE